MEIVEGEKIKSERDLYLYLSLAFEFRSPFLCPTYNHPLSLGPLAGEGAPGGVHPVEEPPSLSSLSPFLCPSGMTNWILCKAEQ